MNPSIVSSNGLFTIGHSNLEMSDFLGTLLRHEIKVVCDVRSRPGSFRFPQFNREPLEARLTSAKIHYEFCGKQSAGGHSIPNFIGRMDWWTTPRGAALPPFLEAIDRAIGLSRERKTAILCAEEDPLHCHRFLLICPALVERGLAPVHLRRAGAAETQRDAEDRLLQLHGFADVTSDSLFAHGREAALEDALRLQSEQYGFRTSPEAIEYF